MMRRLAADRFTRRGTTAEPRLPVGFSALALLIVSLALLVLSRVEHAELKALRWQLAEAIAPVMSAASRMLEPVRWAGEQIGERRNLLDENARLRHENHRLAGWEARARELERRLVAMSQLARVVEESATPFVTARVISEWSGPLGRAVLVEAGLAHSVSPGQPVIGAEGLVGRVLERGQKAARVLLINDQSSRIPVLVGTREVRAVMAGDNGPEPRLQFLPQGAELIEGEEVATSGTGGMLPRGLRIGRIVADAAGGWRVAPHARLDKLDYVSILLTELPVLDVADDSKAPVDARTRRAQVRQGEER